MSLFLVIFLRYCATPTWTHAMTLTLSGFVFVVAILSLYRPDNMIAHWIDQPWSLE